MFAKNIAHAPPAHRRFRLSILMLIALVAMALPSSAQPLTLQFGVGAVGQIDAAVPLSLFVFSGLEGELVAVEIFGLTAGFTPTLTLLSPSQQPIGAPTGSGGALSLAAVLPADGNYSLLVGSLNGQPGEFAIRLDGGVTGQAFPMLPDEQLRAEVVPNGVPQVLTFDASQTGFVLQLGDPFATGPTPDNLRFAAQVVASSGGLLAQFDGVYGALTLVPAGSGRVYVVISGASPEDGGGLDIVLRSPGTLSSTSSSTSSSTTSSSSDPVATPEVTGPVTTTSSTGECTLIAGPNGVNVRAGDSTNFAPITQIEPNGTRAVTGRNANNSWFTIDVNGAVGWVAAQVVTLNGNCSNLQVLSAGSPPPQPTSSNQQGPTATSTATTSNNQQPTQENTQPGPTATPSATPTATTAAPTAPPDNTTHRFDVNRNSGGTLNEVISYPDGDTTDRIEMIVDLGQVGGEATRNVTLTLNCNGNGTQFVRFTLTSPNAQRFGCGQSITVRYSAPFSTGYYYVFMEDGGPAYVNYTLVASTQP
ncbi:MAG: SH3 domain-containing protein [Chloroflexi bacterium]|nr:SH3 domain-containing protein [Chloroflexota bacterium]